MMKRNLKFLLIAVMAAAPLLSPFKDSTALAATIRSDRTVNIRTGAASSFEKIGTVPAGYTADLVGYEDGWYRISWNGQAGYTSMDYWSGNTVMNLSSVNIRESADFYAPVIAKVPAGSEVIVLGRCGEWLYLEYQGITGFSKKTYWDAPESFFDRLPYIAGEMTPNPPSEESQGTPNQKLSDPALADESAGDIYRVISALPAYETAAQAISGGNTVKTLPSGAYYVYKTASGMLNLSLIPNEPGSWIDPGRNTGRKIEPPAETNTRPVVPVSQTDPVYEAGDTYVITKDLPGYVDAAHAAEGEEQAAAVKKGSYIVYRSYQGMINVSGSRTEPGAWINPADNGSVVSQSSAATEMAISQTKPSVEGGHTQAGDRVVEEARKLLGAPYIYGAESWEEGGFDCSGLTQFAYLKTGIEIPRTASWQWAGVATKVTIPSPGDIIVFARNNEIYHVGIYIGNNQMIHAPKPGDVVKISSLNWYYSNGLVKGYLRPYAD